MKNIQDVLRQKELEFERLRKEVEALRLAAPILEDKAPDRDPMPTSPPRKNWP